MGYQYSHLIDPRSYDSQGLCDGIPLRVHRNADLAEAGIIRLRNDWRRYVGPLPLNSFGGGMGPVYNFPSVAIPECHPNRLEIVSYITEFGFLHDDIVDKPKANEGAALDTKSGRERIRSNIVNEIMSIDPLRAKEFIAIWTKGFGVGQDRTHFIDFDDYLHYRVVGRGSFFMTSLTIFGMCLTIPPEEKEEFWRITRPAWAAAVLTNDLQSWDKEWRLFQTQDETDMANGIWVLMKQYSIEIDDAKIMVRRKIREYVAKYVDSLTRIELSPDTARLVEAVGHIISGNVHWGNSAPRYHQVQSLTDLQIAREKNGWPYGSMDKVGDLSDSKDSEKNETI